jgi:hypothetical protein
MNKKDEYFVLTEFCDDKDEPYGVFSSQDIIELQEKDAVCEVDMIVHIASLNDNETWVGRVHSFGGTLMIFNHIKCITYAFKCLIRLGSN